MSTEDNNPDTPSSKMVEFKGRKEWLNDAGDLHREDGPAIEWESGVKEWWVNGKRHREDGPAIEYSNGAKMWHLNGETYYTEESFKEALAQKGDTKC